MPILREGVVLVSRQLKKAVVLFVALTVAGVAIILTGVAVATPSVMAVLPPVGGALIAGALAFFMVTAFGLTEHAG